MPYYIEINPEPDPWDEPSGDLGDYCDEQELLDIANKLREAGGADILAAFMPSVPESPGQCLIANALNFHCEVAGYPLSRWSREKQCMVSTPIPAGYGGNWGMRLPDPKTAQMVADATGWYYDSGHDPCAVALPTRVGNTAAAFDRCEGWTAKYVIDRDLYRFGD